MLMSAPNQQVQNVANTLLKSLEEAGAATRDHAEATMKSMAAINKGFEEISRSTQAFFHESFARSLNASKAMMGARTLPEITDMHQELLKDTFESVVASTGQISQISARVTQDAMSPLTEHATNTVGKFSQKLRTNS